MVNSGHLTTKNETPTTNQTTMQSTELENNKREESTENTREAQLNVFQEMFKLFYQKFPHWFMSISVDNFSTNQNLSIISGKHFPGCYDHYLNVAINKMLNTEPDLIQYYTLFIII